MKGQPVVIVKKAALHDHVGHHGGAWKVAYADFVTAMMAFFLVMWLVAQGQSVRQAVGGYFRNPGVFEYEKSNSLVPGGDIKGGAEAPATAKAREREALNEAAAHLKTMLAIVPEFQKLNRQIKIDVTNEGLRVELLEANEATFFDSGSAAPRPETERVLATIATELGKLENHVIIEGHTDSRPYLRSDGYGNWELSTDRANAARRVMEANGLYEHQVQAVRGYANTRLLLPGEPMNSRNRRVSIVVESREGGSPGLPSPPANGTGAAADPRSPQAAPAGAPASEVERH